MKIVRLTNAQHGVLLVLIGIEQCLDAESQHLEEWQEKTDLEAAWVALEAARDCEPQEGERTLAEFSAAQRAAETWVRSLSTVPWPGVYARACAAEVAIRELIGLPVSEKLRQSAARHMGEIA